MASSRQSDLSWLISLRRILCILPSKDPLSSMKIFEKLPSSKTLQSLHEDSVV